MYILDRTELIMGMAAGLQARTCSPCCYSSPSSSSLSCATLSSLPSPSVSAAFPSLPRRRPASIAFLTFVRTGRRSMEAAERRQAIGLEAAEEAPAPLPSSAAAASRWRLLRSFVLRSSKGSASDDDVRVAEISRKPAGRYNLIPLKVRQAGQHEASLAEGGGCLDASDVVVEYVLPVLDRTKLSIRQCGDGALKLRDFAACGKNSIDSTGIVCLWPAEEVLTYYCATHPDIFKGKSVVELGAGYGLGGLAIAVCADAAEVVITDGNPQVVDYVKYNIRANAGAFGSTIVSGSALYWSRDSAPLAGQTFDIVVAADCTFFKDFHLDLACTIKSLLGASTSSRAILFNPRRGDTLDLFVHVAERQGLVVEMKEQYDPEVWDIHQSFLRADKTGWPNYDNNHCYPILISLRRASSSGTLL